MANDFINKHTRAIENDKSRCQSIVTTWFQCLKKLLWVPIGSTIRQEERSF